MRLPLANSAAECLIAVADVLFGFKKKKIFIFILTTKVGNDLLS